MVKFDPMTPAALLKKRGALTSLIESFTCGFDTDIDPINNLDACYPQACIMCSC